MSGLALLLGGLALLCWPSGRADGRLRAALRTQGGLADRGALDAGVARRLSRTGSAGAGLTTAHGLPDGGRWRRALLGLAAGAAVAVVVGGPAGAVGGAVAVAATIVVLQRAETAQQRRDRDRRTADLPGALDLIAVCLRAGLPVGESVAAVAKVLDGPLRADFAMVSTLHDLGAETSAGWADLVDGPLSPVARAMARSGHSGAALSTALGAVAEQVRRAASERVELAARRAGVFVMAPLGLCFLPAFVCLGVVPTIIGVADAVLR